MKPRTVYALVLTFEENGEVKQHVNLFSLKGNASSRQRAFVSAANADENALLIGHTLEKCEVVPVLDDEGLFLATHAVALTWEGDDGVEQTVELFESAAEADAARERRAQAFANGKPGRLIALTCEKTSIKAPVSEGEAAFGSYMDAVRQLQRA